jgi:hypothetical protein
VPCRQSARGRGARARSGLKSRRAAYGSALLL